MGRPSKTGVPGVTFWPQKCPTAPYYVRWKTVAYGYFPTLESAKEYLELIQAALDGKGEMPAPAREWRAARGLEWKPKEAKPKQKPAPARPIRKQERCCRTCRWRSGLDSTTTSSTKFYCKYGLDDKNHTRLYLHFMRTGTRDLSTFTSDKNCTEWEPRIKK